MRELVNGLAEVYCLTDPSLPDNPIVRLWLSNVQNSANNATRCTLQRVCYYVGIEGECCKEIDRLL